MSILRNVKLTLQDGDRPHPHLKLPRFKWNSGFYTISITQIIFWNWKDYYLYKIKSDLSFLTGDSKYEDYVYNVSKHISKLPGKLDGLVPMWISPESGQFNSKAGSTITLGARTDRWLTQIPFNTGPNKVIFKLLWIFIQKMVSRENS